MNVFNEIIHWKHDTRLSLTVLNRGSSILHKTNWLWSWIDEPLKTFPNIFEFDRPATKTAFIQVSSLHSQQQIQKSNLNHMNILANITVKIFPVLCSWLSWDYLFDRIRFNTLFKIHIQRGVRLRNCVYSFSANNSQSHVHLDNLFLDVELRLLPCQFALKSRMDQILNQLNHNRQIAWLPFHFQIHKFIRSLTVKVLEHTFAEVSNSSFASVCEMQTILF